MSKCCPVYVNISKRVIVYSYLTRNVYRSSGVLDTQNYFAFGSPKISKQKTAIWEVQIR